MGGVEGPSTSVGFRAEGLAFVARRTDRADALTKAAPISQALAVATRVRKGGYWRSFDCGRSLKAPSLRSG